MAPRRRNARKVPQRQKRRTHGLRKHRGNTKETKANGGARRRASERSTCEGHTRSRDSPGLQAGSASISTSPATFDPAEASTTFSATPLNSVLISPASALREPSRPSRLRGATASTSDSAPDRFVEVIGGIDWGYTNPADGLVLARDGDDLWWLLEEFYQRRAALDAVLLPALIDLTRRPRSRAAPRQGTESRRRRAPGHPDHHRPPRPAR